MTEPHECRHGHPTPAARSAFLRVRSIASSAARWVDRRALPVANAFFERVAWLGIGFFLGLAALRAGWLR